MARATEGTERDRQLRVRVLGGFSVEGIEERALGSRKARLLLKRLAVAGGRAVATDELAAAVWGDNPPQRPADQVSVLVSRLRRVLGSDRLPRTDAGYSLAADWFDLVDLERCAVEIEERLRTEETGAALAAGQVALDLAAGGLLPEEDGDWVDEARPAAERIIARARLLAAEAALAAGELSAARAAAQAVLDQDPYDEAALRLVMRSDALACRPGSALAAYSSVRHRLSEDLGVDPTPETERLHTAIVRGEVPALRQTDAASTELVGRTRELSLLDTMLARTGDSGQAAAVVEAVAGMGKSTLVSAWAASVAERAFVMSGRCDELGRDLPLQPLIDGLARHLEGLGREGAADLMGSDGAVLDPLLGRADGSRPSGVTTVADADTSKAALFGALASVLRRAAGSRQLILVIDDLHSSAAGTAEFLAFLLRRSHGVMVTATRRPESGPDLPGAQHIALEPLTLSDVVELVGAELGPPLYERSGGHPLFLRELVAAQGEELPGSIVAAVRSQLALLGQAARTLEAAAACGTEVDAALIAGIMGRRVSEVLDDIETAVRAGFLRPRGATLAFSHELAREAIEAGTSPLLTLQLHRAAVTELAGRRDTDPLALARHARLSADPVVAARALVAAAALCGERFEVEAAERLLDQAIELSDGAGARLTRARLRLARLDLDGAREDALAGIDLGAGVEGFEVAGWVAYYARDYDTALRYAEEGIERATDAVEQRSSCLALAGRVRHARGELAEASSRLEQSFVTAPSELRGVVQVWQGQLLAHRGDPVAAVDRARRGLLDRRLAHPFAAGHGFFTLAYALGLMGQWSAALDAVDDLDALIDRQGNTRFPPLAANLRGWLMRGGGLLEAARELHGPAAEVAPGPTFQEARYAALLDIAECHLAAHDAEAASVVADSARAVLDWAGGMSWRHHNRYRLLAGRLASLAGNHATAAEELKRVEAAACECGDRRYQLRARLAIAAADGRAGRRVDPAAIGPLVEQFVPLSGPDGWRDIGELAHVLGDDQVWRIAETHAAGIVAEAAGRSATDSSIDGDHVAKAVRVQIDQLKP